MVVMATARKRATVKRAGADPYVAALLGRVTIGKQELTFRKNEKIFRQGEPADSIYFIQTGRIKVSVVSATGKEAVLAMPGPHDFFGEGSLVMQSLRVSTAETLEPSTVFRVEKRAMIRSLHEQIQNNGTDRIQRRTHDKDRTVDRSRLARLSMSGCECKPDRAQP